jgi:regulator of nonsense transcripts 1
LRFRRAVYNLYRDTLAAADFVATTPVAAGNHFRGLFKADLVFFDEAPHARELSNLIAIANFNPIAWIFCGDYRQTVPYVGSDSPGCPNIYRPQMQISMMERAAAAGVIEHELLVNHRAFGGLEQLASELWYDGRMTSANTRQTEPGSLEFIRKFQGRFMGDRASCDTPRLLVHVRDCGPERREGTSAWNPTHTVWVMARVLELLEQKEFKRADRDEPGTVLIISPYKKAYEEYKTQVKKLPAWAQSRVETRTVDVVQGHEADFVFIDLVKQSSTGFLDNPNRLCVAMTRARQGEVVMMHPDMVQSSNFRTSRHLKRIYDLCAKNGQVVYVEKDGSNATVLGTPPGSPNESRATSPAETTVTSTVTSTTKTNHSTSPARPVTPLKSRTRAAQALAKFSQVSSVLASDSIQSWLNETKSECLASDVGNHIEEKPPTMLELPVRDGGVKDGREKGVDKVVVDKVVPEKVVVSKVVPDEVVAKVVEGVVAPVRHPWTRSRASC